MALRKKIYLITAIGWTLLITVLSLSPLPETKGIQSPVSDKTIHAVFYLVFTFLWYMALRKRAVKSILPKIFLAAVLYGTVIEVLQYILPFDRDFEVKDMLANMAGAGTGIICIKIYGFCS